MRFIKGFAIPLYIHLSSQQISQCLVQPGSGKRFYNQTSSKYRVLSHAYPNKKQRASNGKEKGRKVKLKDKQHLGTREALTAQQQHKEGIITL